MKTLAQKRQDFRDLHEAGSFIIPNPWDVGSARWLEGQGFKALASTSAGFAWSQARADTWVSCDQVIAHLSDIASAVDIPLNADFESGYASNEAELRVNVQRAVAAGICGLSIEDSTGVPANPLFNVDVSVAKIKAARRAIDEVDNKVLLVGRSEGFIAGAPDLEETIRRLVAYANAGADCLYAPGIRTEEQIRAVVSAVAPKPVNLLIGWSTPLRLADFTAMGVRRISVGGALARSAWSGFVRSTQALAIEGRFEHFGDLYPSNKINDFFAGSK